MALEFTIKIKNKIIANETMDCIRLEGIKLKTHINYKVLWLQTDILGATLRDGLSQACFPALNRLLIEEKEQEVEESTDVNYFILAGTLNDIRFLSQWYHVFL